MNKREVWRLGIIAASVGLALLALYPTGRLYLAPPQAASERADLEAGALKLGLDLRGGTHLLLEVEAGGGEDVLDRVEEILANRVDQFGVAEPVIHRQGDRRIVVELPGVEDAERARRLIGQTARLEFRLLRPEAEREALLERIDKKLAGEAKEGLFEGEAPSLSKYLHLYGEDLAVAMDEVEAVRGILARPEVKALLPADTRFLWGTKNERVLGGREYRRLYLVQERVQMGGEMLQDARVVKGVGLEHAGQPLVELSTSEEGGRLFARITGAHVGERLAIVLDGQIYSAPTIETKIADGRAVITGSRSEEEARDLAIVLRAGALPADVHIIEERTVGPSLGHDSIEEGRLAALVGLAAVALFMTIYYGPAGLVANLALGLNMLFVLAALAGFGGTLTLPGIAGIALTMGMAVDANVLVFERVREELRRGAMLRQAVQTGYARAILTIVDSNLTTVLCGLVLYQFGTGPVKGFALTLMVGIAASMFTAVFVTRTLFDFALRRWKLAPQNLMGRVQFLRAPRFDFLRMRRATYTLSALVVCGGLGAAALAGGFRPGIDFAGGTLLEFDFAQPVDIERLRQALTEVTVEGKRVDLSRSEIKQVGREGGVLVRVRDEGQSGEVAQGIKAVFKERFGEQIGESRDWLRRQEAVGPSIGAELRSAATKAMLFALGIIVLYVWWRFRELRYGVGAVVALIHDVLVTLAFFALTGREISMVLVAALLTIIGYSLNDTIVIYDRIRENLRGRNQEGFADLLNRSINECLARTAITSGTTLMAVLALLLIGGEVLRDFALAMLVGVLAGTYSTVFVATPLVLEWERASAQGLASQRAA